MQVNVELTDTFGGEPNYSWVNRESFDMPHEATDRAIVRAAKAAIGYTGIPCTKCDYGDMIELRPRGGCTVIFITFD